MGHFFCKGYMKIFDKKPTSIEEQIEILCKRNLIIDNDRDAKRFLEYCSYYRFCGYALHFEVIAEGKRKHQYKENISFFDVERLYHFDAALRRIIFHYTTLIEIDFRTTLANESAWYYGDAHWYLNCKNFSRLDKYEKFIDICREETTRSREIFVTAYKNNYNLPELPPIWMLIELMPFAVWSQVYQNINDIDLKKRIALKQGIPEKYLHSWLHALTVLRNCCAHHARIWNRNFLQAPMISPRIKDKIIEKNSKKLVVMLLIIHDMLRKLNREAEFVDKLEDLFEKNPEIDLFAMGVTIDASTLFL